MTNMIKKAIKDLEIGNFVDLEGDKFADPDSNQAYLECELAQVLEIDIESDKCIAVYFDGFHIVGFPPDHEVMVLDESRDDNDDEDKCSECGDEMDLDGYDGKCGNCCDAEADEDEADDRDIVASTGDYRKETDDNSKPYFSPRRLDPNSECPFVEIRSPNPMRDTDFNSPEERVVSLENALREAVKLLAKVRNEYGALHDEVNELIGEGERDAVLTKDTIPDDYEALTNRLVRCVYLDASIQDFVEGITEG